MIHAQLAETLAEDRQRDLLDAVAGRRPAHHRRHPLRRLWLRKRANYDDVVHPS